MGKVFIRHSVADFATWKEGFDGHEDVRQKYGIKNAEAFTHSADPNEVIVTAEMESSNDLANFMADPDVQAKMAQVGVTSEPQVSFVD